MGKTLLAVALSEHLVRFCGHPGGVRTERQGFVECASRMVSCNKSAIGKKGDDRKDFMKGGLACKAK